MSAPPSTEDTYLTVAIIHWACVGALITLSFLFGRRLGRTGTKPQTEASAES